MQPKTKPKFRVLSEPLQAEAAEESKQRLRSVLDEMAVRARESGLTEEKVIELLKNDG